MLYDFEVCRLLIVVQAFALLLVKATRVVLNWDFEQKRAKYSMGG